MDFWHARVDVLSDKRFNSVRGSRAMSDMLTVDRLEVLVIVDNVTDSLSSSSNVAV